jgi:hypothetical protein
MMKHLGPAISFFYLEIMLGVVGSGDAYIVGQDPVLR